MIHLVNLEETTDISAAIASLSVHGTVTQPHPRTPRVLLVDIPESDELSTHMTLSGIEGVIGSCDCELTASLHILDDETSEVNLAEVQTDPGWALQNISGTSLQNEYRFDSTGAGGHLYTVDTSFNPNLAEFTGRASIIYDPNNENQGFHGASTSATAAGETYGPAKDALIFGCAGFNGDGTGGSAARLNAALSAAADHIEDTEPAVAVVNMSWGITGNFFLSDPFRAVMTRLSNLGAILICSSGNGDNTNGFDYSAFGTNVFPAESELVAAVGASDINNVRGQFSNYPTDINAPGVSVPSINADGNPVNVSGTSFSSPYTSGCALCVGTAGSDDPLAYLLDVAIEGGITNVPKGSDTRLFKPEVLNFDGGPVDPDPDPDPEEETPDSPEVVTVIRYLDAGDANTTDTVFGVEQGSADTIYSPINVLDEVL